MELTRGGIFILTTKQSLIEKDFADALKAVARDLELKRYIQQSLELYPLFLRSAKRFVTGEHRTDGIEVGQLLTEKGYAVSLEYIGENTTIVEACRLAVQEFIGLMQDCKDKGIRARISLDLSHIGLSVTPELAYEHLMLLAAEAQNNGLSVVISMEESAKTDLILSIYKKAVVHYPIIGITLQAYLHRTPQDLTELLPYQGLIRIVKGAYQEPADRFIPRSELLDERYLELVDRCVQAGHSVSIAKHDEGIIRHIVERRYLHHAHVEAELLYGIRPDLGRQLKESGFPVRIYLTYGDEWYLYLCHRMAEFPPNLYMAITDMIKRTRTSDLY
jgi:proline dehydrogenase